MYQRSIDDKYFIKNHLEEMVVLPVDVILLGSLVFIYIRRREYIFRLEQHKLRRK